MSKENKRSVADITPEMRLNLAEKEARFLLWCFGKGEAHKHINLNLSRSKPITESDTHEFWKEVKVAFNTIINGKIDEIDECIHLLDFLNTMQPREKWVTPLVNSIAFHDFRTQLFTIIEDYKEHWMKDKTTANDGF
jgi:hypothetical protein